MSLLLYMQRQDHWRSSTAEAITGRENGESIMTGSENSDSKNIIHAIHAQLLPWVLTSTDSLKDGIKEKKKRTSFLNHHQKPELRSSPQQSALAITLSH